MQPQENPARVIFKEPILCSPLNPHDALKHHVESLKNVLISYT